MQTNVTFRHMDSLDTLRQYVEDKVNKVKKYVSRPIEANAVLSVEKYRHIAEISILANRIVIKSKEETGDMYSSIDLAMDKIERQLRKYKERLKEHKAINPDIKTLPAKVNVLTPQSFEEKGEPKVIMSESISIKPMFVDEAAMQLELSNQEFLVFLDASSQKVNVIYRRKDGNFGLIEPEY